MNLELIAAIGIWLTIIGTGVALATPILSGQRSMNVRMAQLGSRLNQRMAHLDGLLEGLREAMFHRAPPA